MTDRHAIEHDEVMAYLDGELPPARAESVRAHLESCEACRSLADDLRQVSDRLQSWDVDPAPARLPASISDALDGRDAESGSRWSWFVVPGLLGLPRWSLAAGSLAAVALVAVVIRPAPDRALQSLGDVALNQAAESPALSPEGRASLVDAAPAAVGAGADSTAEDRPASLALPDAAKATSEVAARERFEQPAASRQAPVPAELSARASPPARADTPPEDPVGSPPPLPAPPPPPAQRVAEPVGQARASSSVGRRNAAANANLVGGMSGAVLVEKADEVAPSLPEPPVAERARLALSTDDLDQASESLAEVASRLGGRIEAQVTAGDGLDRVLTATVRVPVDQLDAALEALRAIGTVREDARDADDVADEARDVSMRLQQAVEQERQLARQLASSPATSGNVATLTRELTSTREAVGLLRTEEAELVDRRQFAAIELTISIGRE
jgi:anti-sigma factor RsiW